ncbi:hypothetical protein EV360DRAFT_75919 [Lentinula raphanica]|nr:hypothetical protein EV360DRAFT_75919 [Lentinula raphanica]
MRFVLICLLPILAFVVDAVPGSFPSRANRQDASKTASKAVKSSDPVYSIPYHIDKGVAQAGEMNEAQQGAARTDIEKDGINFELDKDVFYGLNGPYYGRVEGKFDVANQGVVGVRTETVTGYLTHHPTTLFNVAQGQQGYKPYTTLRSTEFFFKAVKASLQQAAGVGPARAHYTRQFQSNSVRTADWFQLARWGPLSPGHQGYTSTKRITEPQIQQVKLTEANSQSVSSPVGSSFRFMIPLNSLAAGGERRWREAVEGESFSRFGLMLMWALGIGFMVGDYVHSEAQWTERRYRFLLMSTRGLRASEAVRRNCPWSYSDQHVDEQIISRCIKNVFAQWRFLARHSHPLGLQIFLAKPATICLKITIGRRHGHSSYPSKKILAGQGSLFYRNNFSCVYLRPILPPTSIMRMRFNPVHVFIFLLVSGVTVLGKPILGRKKEPPSAPETEQPISTVSRVKPSSRKLIPFPLFSYTFAGDLGVETTKDSTPNDIFVDKLAKDLIDTLFKVGYNNRATAATEQSFVGTSTIMITGPKKTSFNSDSDKLSPDQFTIQIDVPSTHELEKLGKAPFKAGARAGVVVDKIDRDTIEGVLQDADGKTIFEVRDGKAVTVKATTAKTTLNTGGPPTQPALLTSQ